ncbi:tetratricopeptide repeat protein [Aequorivita sp. SDUM287046]|uniref:Tetratricopeptide repeat protein n=1 Tax=Aequorivita aurantiaca TaxID=3053356 RepID=A0ABT8DJ58_9FLAO|nr:tetratricopeptide repeat protein [Aequorivita aurantiaca]MDN3723248.1 tetratricopeptide repeat protein [Aequorivita aurantiaca]
MRNFVFILLFFGISKAFSQSDALAKNYFEQGQFEKALTIYEKLSNQNPYRLDYFLAMVASYQQVEKFSEAEKLLKEKLGDGRNFPQLFVEIGHNYVLQNKQELATDYYTKAIETLNTNPSYAYNVGAAFEKYSMLDQAVTIYEKAMSLSDKVDFNSHLAQIYGEQGKLEKMFDSYLNLIVKNLSFKAVAQRYFSIYITENPTNEANITFKKILLQRSQQNPDILYNDLLSWLFIQQKEYKKAFVQEKAIYKRIGEDLSGITDLAYIAIADEDYETGREIVNFIIENSYTPENKLQGNQILMKMEVKTATPKQYPEVEKKFEKLFEEFGRGRETYLLQIDYNHFLAFQNNRKEEAISNLKKLAKDQLNAYQEARVKMELADILVFDEKFNEALIYYSQIQKKVQSDVLAQEARFKVAQTSYFKGDFEWAQVQLDVLKKSTSQLMANDAMQLSLLIRDNSLEDSTQTALRKYARADLLAFQDKNSESIAVLEDILTNNKGEKIEDEALLKQGKLFEKTGEFEKAETNYLKIIEFYKEDILADDAHYRLAQLYETKLNQPEKAKQEYEQIIFNYADSIYFVEARKKFRSLRGDEIN